MFCNENIKDKEIWRFFGKTVLWECFGFELFFLIAQIIEANT